MTKPHSSNLRILYDAARYGKTELLNGLIKQSINGVDYNKALCLTSANGHTECVKLLIPVSDPKNCNALSWASISGHAECVKFLIHVSDPKINNSYALRMAAEKDHFDCVELLLPHSDISKWDNNNWSFISFNVKQIIVSYFSKIFLEQNISINNKQISETKIPRKI